MDQARAIWNTVAVRAAADSGDYGAVVRAVRRAKNLTLADVAARINYSPATLSRLERGIQHLTDIQTLRTLADALDIPPHMLGVADTPPRSVRIARSPAIVGLNSGLDEESDMRRRTLLTGLTGLAGTTALSVAAASPHPSADPLQALEQVLLTAPSHGIPASIPKLHGDITAARAKFDLGRYAEVANALPGLLTTAIATYAAGERGDEITSRSAELARIYTLASQVTVKLGRDQLAWTAADRAMQIAHNSDDLLVQAAARRAWAIVLRRTGHADTAGHLIIDTATLLQPKLGAGPQYLAVYGSLLSTAAYTAAVDGDRDTSTTLINESISAATRLDHSARSLGFGTTAAGLYRISIARVLGDAGAAIELAQRIDPAAIASPERRARFWSDIARAFHQWDKPELCYRALLAAEKAAPDEVRYRTPIQQITRSLIRHPASTNLPGLHSFAHRSGTSIG
ncbi:helix-turn-helix domain-containing protein [Nocardia miyunensis]|uniref:helix-turn-helix domain-containing protein n=1 Tax=Nocardia miyunensis TaxID=282684 RepID=UPI00082E25A0|nr:helix-turn-helix transcriptional regulator [Nocardia miyunensis]